MVLIVIVFVSWDQIVIIQRQFHYYIMALLGVLVVLSNHFHRLYLNYLKFVYKQQVINLKITFSKHVAVFLGHQKEANVYDVFRHIIKTEGFRGLFRGLHATIWRDSPTYGKLIVYKIRKYLSFLHRYLHDDL